jgi:CO/xanthine dehydrogenase Mo-binding subunit
MAERQCPEESKGQFIGRPVARVEELEKITGAARFVDDLDFGPDLLHAVIIESPHAHALIISIDPSAALKIPGVIKVVTGSDFPYKFGLYMKDRYILALDRVRFVGEQVAAVIARCPKIARRAARLVKIKYEVLPAVLNVTKALEDKAAWCIPILETTRMFRGFSLAQKPTSPIGARRGEAISRKLLLNRTSFWKTRTRFLVTPIVRSRRMSLSANTITPAASPCGRRHNRPLRNAIVLPKRWRPWE